MTASKLPSHASQNMRDIILDAAEHILKSEGYSGVSSRKITQHIGMKSRVIHYHFGSMDDLFVALIRRIGERYFDYYESLLDSPEPVGQLWENLLESVDSVLLSEMTALASRREAVRGVTLDTIRRARQYDIQLMERVLRKAGAAEFGMTPTILAVLLSGLIRVLAAERPIGMTNGHDDALGYIIGILNGQPASPRD